MAGDDALARRALATILTRAASGDAIYLGDQAECDVDLDFPRFGH